jgi:hypothetical protein
LLLVGTCLLLGLLSCSFLFILLTFLSLATLNSLCGALRKLPGFPLLLVLLLTFFVLESFFDLLLMLLR